MCHKAPFGRAVTWPFADVLVNFLITETERLLPVFREGRFILVHISVVWLQHRLAWQTVPSGRKLLTSAWKEGTRSGELPPVSQTPTPNRSQLWGPRSKHSPKPRLWACEAPEAHVDISHNSREQFISFLLSRFTDLFLLNFHCSNSFLLYGCRPFGNKS